MRKITPFLLFIFTFSIFGIAFSAESLTKNLYQGIKDSEVVVLQKFLNTSSDTLVSSTDAGSIGNETDYFGAKTKNAVVRFQNKYASEILTPIGLSYGTGYVGSLTRQKINSLLGATGIATSLGTSATSTSAKDKIKSIVSPVLSKIFGTTTISTTGTTTVANTTTSTAPKITKITPEILNDGDTLTIYGTGFTTKNSVFLSIEPIDKYVNIVSTDNGTKISLPIKTLLGETVMAGFQNNLEHLSSNVREQAISKILEGYRTDNSQGESSERAMLVPTILRVENENGKSENMVININIFKELF